MPNHHPLPSSLSSRTAVRNYFRLLGGTAVARRRSTKHEVPDAQKSSWVKARRRRFFATGRRVISTDKVGAGAVGRACDFALQ